MKSMKAFRGSFFSLHYPAEWELIIVEHVPTLFHPAGPGAMIIVSYYYEDPDGVDTRRELARYLKLNRMDVSGITEENLSGALHSSKAEFIFGERYWLAYMLGKEHKYILLLWNSEDIPAKGILQDIRQIVSSVEFF